MVCAGGIPFEFVLLLLKSDGRFMKVSKETVKKSMRKLEKESLIYDVNREEYRAV
jgi:Mn-dependent DtxR family transcriptional regulator